MPTQGSSTYLFVDGGYLSKKYSQAIQPWFGSPGEIDYQLLKGLLSSNKMFYYDCLKDIQEPTESPSDFEARVAAQEQFFSKIKRIYGTHVVLGSLTGTPKNKRQKKVDVLLSLDMVKHAVRGNMMKAVLLAGDLDFEPVVKFLVDEGLHVEVVADDTGIASDLADAADYYRPLSINDYFTMSSPFLRAQYPLPNVFAGAPGPPSNGIVIAQGSLAGDSCTLLQAASTFVLFIPSFRSSQSLTITFADPERIKLFCKLIYGELQGI